MKSKISLVLVLVMVAGLLTACTVITGSGTLKTESMDFSDFTGVEVGNAFEVAIVRSDSFSVSITADDNLFDYIRVSKRGSVLKIGVEPAVIFHSATYRAEITMPELFDLELSGASHGTVTGFESVEDLDIEVSGASSLNIEGIVAGDMRFDISGASQVTDEVDADDVEFDVSGASTVRLQGVAADMELELSGASNAEMDDFLVSDASVNFSGASRGTVNVDGRLDVELSGASKLTYTGDPTIGDVDISGASTMQSD
jgi:cytoskeletal protein CcmA (bactofilin family)